MLKMPKVAVRVHAKKKFDKWIAGYGLLNALTVCMELQKLLRVEKKRRKKLENKI